MSLRVVLLAGLAVLAGCSARSENGGRISGQGVSIEVPDRWDGRITDRGWPLPGGVLVQLASFELPEGDDPGARRARKAMRAGDVVLELAEGLRNAELPVQRRRIARTKDCARSAATRTSTSSSSRAAARLRFRSRFARGGPRSA